VDDDERKKLEAAMRDIACRDVRTAELERSEDAIDMLRDLSVDEWRAVMSFFCSSCGGPPSCQCWNDE